MSDRTWQVIVTAGAGLALLVVLRIVLGVVFDRVVNRAAKRKSPDHAARLRTRLTVLRRVILAFVFVVVLWSVLEIFPATEQIARTLLASSAFVALVLGVAFSVPLGNIGAGILLSLSQPVRIGDRITRRRRDGDGRGDHARPHDREDGSGPHGVRAQLADGHVDRRQPVAGRSPQARVRTPAGGDHGTRREGA